MSRRGLIQAIALVTATPTEGGVVKLSIPPLARDELELKLMVSRRGRDPELARQLRQALRKGGTHLEVSRDVAKMVIEELRDSLRIMQDPYLAKEPSVQYQTKAIETAIKELSPFSARRRP